MLEPAARIVIVLPVLPPLVVQYWTRNLILGHELRLQSGLSLIVSIGKRDTGNREPEDYWTAPKVT